MKYDLFISHASEDKASFVRPLAEELVENGLRVWFDECSLSPGDSLRYSIDKGLANSKFAIVVFSDSFFSKKWPNWELNGLVQRHLEADYPLIIPIWHGVNADDVKSYSPSLADIVAIQSSFGISEIALKVYRTINNNKYHYSEAPIFENKLSESQDSVLSGRFDKAIERINTICAEIFEYKVSITILYVPTMIEDELVLKPIHTSGIDKDYISLVVPAKRSLTGMALTQNSYVYSKELEFSGNVYSPLSKYQIKSLVAIPIKLGELKNKGEVVGILSLSSTEKLELTEEALKQLQDIVHLALEPIFELFMASGQIALTRQSSRRANARA